MATATEPGMKSRTSSRTNPAALRHAYAARQAGVPRDQLENFLRAGIVLQERQLQASAAARACDLTGGPTDLGFGGARGGGKSHWGLCQVAADDCQRFAGLKCLFLRKVGKSGRESFEDLRRRVLLQLRHKYNRNEGLLTFPNDSRIVLGHYQNESDVDAYLGIEYDVILVEEATTLTSRKYRDISTCCRTSKPGWRPRIYNTTNPGNIGHQWYKALFIEPFRRGRESVTRFVPATVRDNAFVNREYRQRLEKLIGWQRRAWLDGDWDISAGQFFTTFRREWEGKPHHVIPAFELPQAWVKWGSFDYGFTHFSTFYLFAMDGDGNLYACGEHGERGWLPQRHAPAIYGMLASFHLEPRDLWKIVAGADVFQKRGTHEDSPLTIADAYRDLGLVFEAANDDRIQGAAEILRRLGDAEAGIPPRFRIFQNCTHLADSLPALEHDPNFPEKVRKVDTDDEGIGGDDWYDGARYGVMEAYGGLDHYLDDVPANEGPGPIFGGKSNW